MHFSYSTELLKSFTSQLIGRSSIRIAIAEGAILPPTEDDLRLVMESIIEEVELFPSAYREGYATKFGVSGALEDYPLDIDVVESTFRLDFIKIIWAAQFKRRSEKFGLPGRHTETG